MTALKSGHLENRISRVNLVLHGSFLNVNTRASYYILFFHAYVLSFVQIGQSVVNLLFIHHATIKKKSLAFS